MGTCKASPVDLLGASTCRVESASWSLREHSPIYSNSRHYSKVENTQQRQAYAWPAPALGRDCTGSNERRNGEQSPCHDEIQSDDGPQTMGGGILEEKTSKRKMKRFRLTHSQTRYLMSEFTRQAHPDAAHRERLSREIPGLSPRQVQVWFQNRRAKLKRLSTDDRERILKSRAVPEDFDMAKALRWPYTNYSNTPASAATHCDNSLGRNDVPLVIESIKLSGEEYVTAPSSSPPTYGYYASDPLSVAEDNTSPDNIISNSSANERKLPVISWTYSQMPTPPSESATVPESTNPSEVRSPLNRKWSGVSLGGISARLSPSKLSPHTMNRSLNTPITPSHSYYEKQLATPVSVGGFHERSGKHSQNGVHEHDLIVFTASQKEVQSPMASTMPTTPLSVSSEEQVLRPNSCFGLSSFDISCPQGASPTMGYTASGVAFEPSPRFVEIPYSTNPVKNMWDMGS
ncbi:Homeobox domain containing protein [Coccidioides posadasii C735 delta SOWgp]|uniref:Homeobox domain containing protein n=1 Tax=Coccidioides posadasii (strain C735) TaxID=222929 RepID=C5P3V2_COCP7|nr:Homeobox domain containing protein [Coccidioides posadasii C735 delta SOWgp]EER28370.1 Homeobox domain containing protein [Coccidioides posadasii C735 delta SOWgp]|eukprot:XP_003070515.1 Homeobox domain containing protein [Coccidioides posadasii C735 delta SOWgp]